MGRHRSRRLLITVAVSAFAVLAVGLYASRDLLEETWLLRGFERLEGDAQLARIESLASCGGSRTSVVLADLIESSRGGGALSTRSDSRTSTILIQGTAEVDLTAADSSLAAIETLSSTLARSDGDAYARVGAAIRAVAKKPELAVRWEDFDGDSSPLFVPRVGALAARRPRLLRELLPLLDSPEGCGRELVATAFRELYARDPRRAILEAAPLTTSSLISLASTASVESPRVRSEGEERRLPGILDFIERLALVHPAADVRAASLGAATLGLLAHQREASFEPIGRAYREDSSPRVRVAAVRLAGLLGARVKSLDLRALVRDVSDSSLLTEVLAARAAAVSAVWHIVQGVELWDGFLLECPQAIHRDSLPLEPAERSRLRELLAHESDPALRDAASRVLATDLRVEVGAARRAPVEAGLRVHEWGVWRDTAEGLAPASDLIADLPAFVRRSEGAIKVFQEERGYRQRPQMTIVLKPVVFFHAERPVDLLVRVGFYRGGPWTWFPEASDTLGVLDGAWTAGLSARTALEDIRFNGESVVAPSARALVGNADDAPVASPSTRIVAPWFHSPWGEAAAQAAFDRAPTFGDLTPNGFAQRRRPDLSRGVLSLASERDPSLTRRAHGRSAPWIVERSEGLFRSLGLEWRGLRVGYPDALEPPAPSVRADHWWSTLRDVGAARVAMDDASERFLFYDGSTSAPGPVRVRWESAARRALVLAVRPFEEYPDSGVPGPTIWGSLGIVRDRRTQAPERHPERHPVPWVWVFHRDGDGDGDGGLRGRVLSALHPTRLRDEVLRVPLDELDVEGDDVIARFTESLVASGLSPAEARSLVVTWEREFFETPGTRVISALPRWMLDATLPLDILPRPEDLRRVGLVWRECDDLRVGADGWLLPVRGDGYRRRPWSMPTELDPAADAWTATRPPEVAPFEGMAGHVFEHLTATSVFEDVTLSASGDHLGFAIRTPAVHRPRVLLADLSKRTLADISSVLEPPGSKRVRAVIDSSERFSILRCDSTTGTRHVIFDRTRLRAREISDDRPLTASGSRVLLYDRRPDVDGVLRLLDVDSGEARRVFESDIAGQRLFEVRLDASATRVAFGYGAPKLGDVFVIDMTTGELIEAASRPGDQRLLHFSRDGQRVIIGSVDEELLSATLEEGNLFLADLATDELVDLRVSSADFGGPQDEPSGEVAILDLANGAWLAVDLDARALRPLDEAAGAEAVAARPGGFRAAFVERDGPGERLVVRDYPW